MKPDHEPDHEAELDAALDELEGELAARRALTRQHARAVLIALGGLLGAGGLAPAEAGTRRLAGLLQARQRDWERAVRDELELACTEFVRSVDPRYLGHPRYDFAYTISARELLEARLAAVRHLGLVPDPRQLEAVARADARLAPYLRRRPADFREPGRP